MINNKHFFPSNIRNLQKNDFGYGGKSRLIVLETPDERIFVTNANDIIIIITLNINA